jgi:hypothetical protein
VRNEGSDYFNTKNIKRAEEADTSNQQPRSNWRDYVKQRGLQSYLLKLDKQVVICRNVRQQHLCVRYSFAYFSDFDGNVWHIPQVALQYKAASVKN